MLKYAKQLYEWMGTRVYSPHANLFLGVLFYLEAIFFLPTDPMLVLYCIERQNKAYRFAAIATCASVLGGITGYFMGLFLWNHFGQTIIHNSFINYIVSPSTFTYLSEQYKHYDWLAILIAGFTPIPYKAATLTAGFCKLSFIPFVLCSIIARGARFFLIAGVITIFGPQMKKSIDRYFNIMVILTLVIIGLVFLFFR